ncbi:CUB domain-containing protein [Phthorimaea operculella]|nr:CUB domain-containing protein [Phthorimaea operculella]
MLDLFGSLVVAGKSGVHSRTMRRTLAQCVLILTGLAYLRADVYRDRPTIKANDGHLIIQPAADKNIYLLTNGFRSTVFVAGVNALNINVTRGSNDQSQPDLTDLEKYINEPGANAYHCLCPKNWEGKDCDVDVNECRIYQGTELGCQNLANCKNLPGSYECECRPGWYGIHCTRRRKDCSAGGFEMCGHGTCVTTASGEGITCICDQGWTTNGTDETCLTDVNECESTQGPRCSLNPRVECINLPGSFRCGQCPSGYEGDGYICSDIDECTTSNGGCSTSPFVTCHNTVGSRICGPCPTGYQGDGITCSLKSACSIDHGGCHPSAQCVDNAAAGEQMVQCICPQGTDGDGIGLHGCYVSTNNLTRGCDSKPCGIHGQCHPLRFGYTCFCVRGYGGAHCNMTQNYCDSNPCLNGGTCRNDQSLPRGFRCECTYLFHGELCHLPAKTCGGHLSAEEGSIVYPTNNQTYENNVRCAWVINTESNKVINVTFSKFNLESGNHDKLNEDCNLDFLQIHDGISSSSQLIGRFCGSEFPRGGNIISSHNNLYLWFRSDSSIVSDGFALHWTSINPVCGGEIDATVNGHISSPGSPGKYPPNRDCYWHITTTYGKRIQLHFYSFDIESHSNCSFDSVTIYDGALTTDPLLGRYCSSSIPAPVTSSGSEMLVHFHSDGFSAGYGFQATFAPADGIPGCGGLYTTDKGEISSPSYDGKYLSGITCEYQIRTDPETKIRINFKSFHLEYSTWCKYDYLKVYDGSNENSPLVGKFCGRSHPESYTSSTNQIFIIFRSDAIDAAEGFRFTYETICHQVLQGDSGFIKSPGYPLSYPANRMCEYLIGTTPRKAIQLTFQDFDIEDNSFNNCLYDNIEIRDGLNVNATLLGKKNVLVLQFISDSSGSSKGFKASFTVICGATITADHDGIIAIDKWHTSHIVDNCSWTLIAPSQEQKISLTITFMSIPKDKNTLTNRRCPSTFLRVVDGDNADAPLVDEYCGRKIPPMVVSRGSAMTLVFAAYNGTAQGQFSAHYSSIMSACGGVLTSEEGSIASPNYPQSYPIDSNCEWILSTSPGNKVYITFEQFDIKWSENCNEDYLEVRENDAAGNLLGVYCGTSIPTNTSSATKLYIKFKSNKDNSGKGFLMRYGFLHGNEIYGLEKGEVASPHLYEGAGDFFWRISTERETISIVITTAEIPSDNPICTNSLIIYDGYDEHAPILENLCGVLKTIKEIKTTTNTVFIQLKLDETNSGSIFYIQWANSDTSPEPIEQVSRPNCGFNKTKSLTAGQTVTITSPGYPNNYRENLNCEWVFKAPPGQHVNLHFLTFKLEETEMCFADSLSIYSANTPTMWKAVKEEFCLSSESRNELNSSTYMKIVFKTDSSNNKEGFQAQVYPLCGGIINDLSGVVEPRYEDFIIRRLNHKCEWTIKVRPDRKIKLHFEHFNITNTENECGTYVIIRNGDSIEAPMLGNGKYCGREFENREDLETSSNAVFISYHSNLILISPRTFRNFRIHFEEKGMECGGTFALDEITNWKVFNSPDYPNVPTPYSECEWVFKGPPGVVLRIEFIERFDLEPNDDCSLEFVEIRDGLTDLAPLVGRYCKPDLSTIKTRDNNVYVKYYTQLSEPRNGFKANVSIDVCGGTINAVSGEITSPGYPRLLPLPRNTKCEWRIIGLQRYNLLIKTLDMHLPIVKGRNFCNTNVTIEEYEGLNNMAILKTFCATGLEVENHDHIYDMSPISTSGNEVVIKFELGDYSAYNHITRGFRFKFLSTSPICGGQLTIPEGFITSPGYPQETTMSFCMWHITVPDKTRRIRLEILDSNSERHLIAIFNGYSFHTAIKGLNENLTTNMYESTGNIMTINLVLKPGVMRHRFKARFSSDEASLCGGELHEPRGVLASSPDLNGAYTCEWHFKPKFSTDTANPTTFNTLYINAKLNSSRPEPASYKRSYCLYSDPKLNLGFKSNEHFYNIRICGITEKSIIIPVTEITLYAMKNKEASSYYQVKWKLYPCGGIIEVSENPTNIFNLPDVYNETLECAWLLTAPLDTRVELKIEGSFQSDCVKEIVYIGRGYDNDDYSNAQNIGEYCTDKMQILPLRVSFNTMSVRYHFDVKNKTQLRLIVKSLTDHCGETLTDKQPIFKSPNYPKNYDPNIECSWEIVTDVGNRISLHFIESFRIEERSNCSKDAVLIYDRDDEDDSWVQLARLCGRSLPPTYNSTHNRMKVVLRTDADVQMDGFKARWEPICGGTYIATDKLQYLHSPGYSNCDCDFVEVIDGVNPHDLIIGTYCGYIIPGQELMSSKNMMSLRMYTDGEIVSAGFKAELSLQRQICGQTVYEVNYSTQTITSPGYSTGSIPSSLRCIYYLDASTENKNLHIHIKNLDLQAGKPEPSTCNMDKLLIAAAPQNINAGLGKDYIFRKADFNNMNFYKENEANPDRYEFCGFKTDTDIYLTGSVSIHLQTYPESGLIKHKGFEIEFSYVRFCGRNYTELQGRIKTSYGTFNGEKTPDCYTFITVPKNFTISLYFIFVFNPFTLDGVLDIYDGSTRSNARLHRFTNDVYDTTAIFSSGNQILLYNQVRKERFINYELVYMATDKGRGCGGKLQNVLGSVTSPLYPDTYQKQATCEWELETPSNTRLRLKFTVFDLGIACDGNYVQLVGRSGETIATYCDEPPAVHTSTDNYVKIVYATDRRNSGTGWVANFKAVL